MRQSREGQGIVARLPRASSPQGSSADIMQKQKDPKSRGIAEIPRWLTPLLTKEMTWALCRGSDDVDRTLTEEETVTLLRNLGFEIDG
jgi:hypothetical protein